MNKQPVKILLVEDSPSDAFLVRTTLTKASEEFQVECVETLEDCLDKLQSKGKSATDIILLDLGLPDSLGLGGLLQILAQAKNVPTIVLTGRDDQELALQALNLGAEDYIVKGAFDSDSLCRALIYAIRRKRTQARLEIQLKMTKIFSEVESSEECIQLSLSAVCDWLNCDAGVFWTTEDNGQRIKCKALYTRGNTSMPAFERATLESCFAVGQDIPGIVWASQECIFVQSLESANFSRSSVAVNSKLMSIVACPVRFREQVAGVLEFYSTSDAQPDEDDMQQLSRGVGSQLGQYIARKQVEQSQTFLAAIVRDCEDPIIGKNTDNVITSWNLAAERLYGYSPEDAIGRPIAITVPPELLPELAVINATIASGRSLKNHETIRVRKDGERINVSVTISPICDSSGKIIGASSIVRDITRQKRLEQREELLTRDILHHAPVGIARLNENMEIILANSKLKEVCGENSNSSSLFGRFPGLQQEAVFEAINQLHPYVAQRFVHADGENVKHLDITIWPAAAEESLIGAVLHVLDATAEVELERQRETFIASIIHDIKNPLTGAKRLLQALTEKGRIAKEEERDRLLLILQESNDNLLDLLHKLVDVYQYRSETSALYFEKLAPETLLNSCIDQLSELAATKSLDVSLQLNSSINSIFADCVAMRRVVYNLLHNAIKFSPTGGQITVEISQDESRTTFSVADNGCGIQPNEVGKLFGRYSQGMSGRKAGVGSGLGLFVCHSIVTAHNGTIHYEPHSGGGAKFVVSIANSRRSNG
ncbi:MAG: PAS domain S-box protein [Candidatus Obscuribacterales bacterium]|nr:PAS domain S-box protein [Candidatus Obscuribacterales bacterium]